MGLFNRKADSPPASKPSTSPKGASGRAHTGGYLELEELNRELIGQRGLKIYDRMFRTDGDVRQIVQLCCNPVIGGTWYVQPYGREEAKEKDVKIAQFIQWMLLEFMDPNLSGHLSQFLPVLLRSGFAPGEQVWAKTEYEGEQRMALKNIGMRLPRSIYRWGQDKTGNLTWIEQFDPSATSNNGSMVQIPAKDLVYYRLGAEGDNWEGVSMLRPAYKHWKLKDMLERIDAIGSEREAVGIPICYPPLSATPDQLDSVEDALGSMRTNEQGYIIAPGPYAGDSRDATQGWRIEILSQAKSGKDLHPSLEYHTNKIAAAAISEFMRLNHSSTGSSGAAAQVQADPFQQAVESIASLAEEVLNPSVVERAVEINFPDAEGLPRLCMSQVSQEGITEIADFCNKLITVGAMIPDQHLENFLRERAELPPADPEAVEARDDDAMSRQGSLAAQGKPFGQTPADEAAAGGAAATPGGSAAGKGKSSSGKSPAPKPQPGASKPKPGSKSATLDQIDMPDTPQDDERYPARRDFERNISLSEIEDTLDGSRHRLPSSVKESVYRAARKRKPGQDFTPPEDLTNKFHSELSNMYHYGRQTVRDEVARQLEDYPTLSLDRGQHDRDSSLVIQQRAEMATRHFAQDMGRICEVDDLQRGDSDSAASSLAVERAAEHRLRHHAVQHSLHAFQLGRHDESQDLILDDAVPTIGVRYTSILDHNRCDACAEADDDQVRDFDDPVRLSNKPPNPHCHSMASGNNMCRCLEHLVVEGKDLGPTLDAALVPNDPAKTNWVEKAGGLPKAIADMAGDLITERGMTTSEAIATAVSQAKKLAAKGNAKYVAAVAEWERKKASS